MPMQRWTRQASTVTSSVTKARATRGRADSSSRPGSVHVEQHRRRSVVLGIVKSRAYHRKPLAEQRQRAFARQRVHPDLNTVLNFLVLALDVLVVVGAVRIVFQLDRGH
jgi:hypothetical protein